MSINNLPVDVQDLIVQENFLTRFFEDAVQPMLRYRGEFSALQTPNHMGESFTITKKGLLARVTAPLAPVNNSDLTSGLTPTSVKYEQYGVTMNQYGNDTLVNLVASSIALEDLFRNAVEELGDNAGRSLDGLSRRRLFEAYGGGRSYFTAASGPATTAAVENGRGFDFHYVSGVRTATSVTNPLVVTITQSGTPATKSVTNVSFGAYDPDSEITPATLTFSANVTVVVGDTIVSSKAPYSLRPNGKTSSFSLTASDILVIQNLVDAAAELRRRGVPPHEDMYYHGILNAGQVAQLFKDNAFQRTWTSNIESEEFQSGLIGIAGGVKIYTATETPDSVNPAGVPVHRAIITGRGVGYEARAAVIARWLEGVEMSATGAVRFSPESHVALVFRQPLDVLQQVVTVAWSFIGDWVCATDSLSTFGGNASAYIRAAVIESA